MSKLYCILLVFMSLQTFGQGPSTNPGTLPSVIPPSPEVASLNTAGKTSTNIYTGTASVQIPLYEIKVGQLSLPIALSYSSNGTRVNDVPGRVGIGWNIVAGGSVNRTVHDEEDENTLTVPLAPVDFTNIGQSLQYAMQANIEHYDTENDELHLRRKI